MASTRNRNTPGNYNLEQKEYRQFENYTLYANSQYLVNPAPCFVPELTKLDSTNIYEKGPTLMPEPLVVEKSQRPFPVPN